MKLFAVALFASGLIGAIVANIKYQQRPEWEHWAEKLTYLLTSIVGAILAVVGAVMFIIVI